MNGGQRCGGSWARSRRLKATWPPRASTSTAARDALAPYVERLPGSEAKSAGAFDRSGRRRRDAPGRDRQLPGDDRLRSLPFPGPRGRASITTPAARRRPSIVFQPLADREPPTISKLRWLLNLSAMLLGRLSRRRAGEAPASRRCLFIDGAGAALHRRRARGRRRHQHGTAGGTIIDDFDGDGLLDIVLHQRRLLHAARLLPQHGRRHVRGSHRRSRACRRSSAASTPRQTDYNNDGASRHLHPSRRLGDPDAQLAAAQQRRRHVHRRDEGRGPVAPAFRTHSAAWADYDNDGWLDVFVGHELAPSQLFRNRGDGTFEDVTVKAGVGATAFTKGVVWGDYDNDGYPDLYVSNMFGDNLLYHNNRRRHVRRTWRRRSASRSRSRASRRWFFDYDNDGWLDLFVVAYPNSVEEFVKHYLGQPPIAETLKLYHNNGNGTFTDVSAADGPRRASCRRWAPTSATSTTTASSTCISAPARPRSASLMPNIMLKNDAGRRFADVTEATGTGHLQKGHGVAFADLDNDGDEDIVLNVGGAVPGDRYDDAALREPGRQRQPLDRACSWSASGRTARRSARRSA